MLHDHRREHVAGTRDDGGVASRLDDVHVAAGLHDDTLTAGVLDPVVGEDARVAHAVTDLELPDDRGVVHDLVGLHPEVVEPFGGDADGDAVHLHPIPVACRLAQPEGAGDDVGLAGQVGVGTRVQDADRLPDHALAGVERDLLVLDDLVGLHPRLVIEPALRDVDGDAVDLLLAVLAEVPDAGDGVLASVADSAVAADRPDAVSDQSVSGVERDVAGDGVGAHVGVSLLLVRCVSAAIRRCPLSCA